MRRLKVVGLLDTSSQNPGDAYTHRVISLLEGLREDGHETSLLYLQDRGATRPSFRRSFNGRFFRDELLAADVIHAANCTPAAAAIRAVGGRVPVIFDVHGDVPAEARLFWEAHHSRSALIDMWTMPVADRVARRGAAALLVVSNPLRELYLKAGVPPERIFLVRNGVDLSLFSPTRVPTAKLPIIGYAGATQVWQGLPMLLDAFAGWHGGLKLRVIGFQPADAALKAQFASQLGDRADLHDAMPRENMIELLRECHALVIPRKSHPAVRVAMPTKFGEYAALGRPLLLTDVDEMASFVRQYECGWVADPTPAGLRSAFDRVVAAGDDCLAQMGANARRVAEEICNWDRIREDYRKAIEFAVGPFG
jgi:glycosyltransferase involved in cell wall biosynthesis